MHEILEIDVDKIIFLTKGIRGYPHHFFTADHTIYQQSHCAGKRTKPAHLVAKVLNGMCRGYFINGKFKSLTYLEKKSYPVAVKVIIPQDAIIEMPF